MTTPLQAALEAFKPELIASYTRIVERQFEDMTQDLGETLKGVSNSWKWYKIYANIIAPNSYRQTNRYASPVRLDPALIAQNAAQYADSIVITWAAKIAGKMGELDNASVARLNGYMFRITGTKFGHAVAIEQDMITNVSKSGTLYNQFPARLYVDGKFTSEAKFKKLQPAAPVAEEYEEDDLDLGAWVPDEEDPDCAKADALLIARRRARY